MISSLLIWLVKTYTFSSSQPPLLVLLVCVCVNVSSTVLSQSLSCWSQLPPLWIFCHEITKLAEEGNREAGLHTFVKANWSTVECKTEIMCFSYFPWHVNYWGSFRSFFFSFFPPCPFLPCSKRRITLCGLLVSSSNLAITGSLRWAICPGFFPMHGAPYFCFILGF